MEAAVNQLNAQEKSYTPCRPGLVTVAIFIAIVVIDLFKQEYSYIPAHVLLGIVASLLMYTLCSVGVGIVAWILLILPFLLIGFGYLIYSIRRHEKTVAAKQQLLSTESKPAPYVSSRERPFFY